MDLLCKSCGESYGPDDLFCENCGYDFITGSLPDGTSGEMAETTNISSVATTVLPKEEPQSDDQGTPEPPTGSEETEPLRLEISVSREFFDHVVKDGEVTFPDPVPPSQELELHSSENHIGRTSQSRAIHPDIDIFKLTGDEAVSSRHAIIRYDAGVCEISDVGSTNGTIVGSVDNKPLERGSSTELASGTTIYVGAWTCLEVL